MASTGNQTVLTQRKSPAMNTLRVLFVCLAFAAGVLRSQDNPAPTPAADAPPAPPQSEMQKWIATTDAQWQATFKRDVSDVHEADINKVKLQYLTSLEDAIKKASAGNDLKGALALRDEQKRFGDTQAFPEKDEEADAPAVKAVRTAIRAQLVKLEKDHAVRAKALHAKYDQALAQAQAQLTKAERLDDALLVQNKRDEVKTAWLAGLPAVAAPEVVLKPAAPQAPAVPVSKQVGAENIEKKLQNTTWLWQGKQHITFLPKGKATWTFDRKAVLDWRMTSDAARIIEGHTPAGRPFSITFEPDLKSGSLKEDRFAARPTMRTK